MWKSKSRWAVFISGTGSNLNAILDERPFIDVGLVVSSTPKAYGLIRAKRAGVPAIVLKNPIDWDTLDQDLRDHRIEKIFLLGFMKLLPGEFVAKWAGNIINVHPSLLPAYPGLESIKKAFDAKDPLGVTVHHVITEMDAGPHVIQRGVERLRDFEKSQFAVHLSEQRLVRESVRRCRIEAI